MKKIFTILLTILAVQSFGQAFWTNTSYKGAFPVTDGTPASDWTTGWSNFNPENTNYPNTTSTLSSDITTSTTLSGVILLENKIYVKNGATLTILPGTIIRGDLSTQGTLIITKGSKIIAEGTQYNPIVFTSNEPIGDRAEGDWGGLVILGKAVNNQPGGIANIEGIAPTPNTEFGGNDDFDNSGILKFVRVEFAGIALEPNKEINGITFGSVGSSTQVDYIQVSFSGDDSYEWFGGTVNCKHLIAYRGIDDDFDTDFGYRGKIQFGLSIRDNNMYDAVGASNCFESDNDATGSNATPQTAAVFSNITTIGPRGNGSSTLPVGEKFEKAFQLRRNTSISIFNSLVTGWEKGISVEGLPVETNFNLDSAVFSSNILSNIPLTFVTAQSSFYSTFFTQNNNDSLSSVSSINWVNAFVSLGSTPDVRLNSSSIASTGADFSSSKFTGGFLGISELNDNVNALIFPNPTSDFINLSGSGRMNVYVYDAIGKVVINHQIQEMGKIDVSNLNKGIYLIGINNKFTKKIVIE